MSGKHSLESTPAPLSKRNPHHPPSNFSTRKRRRTATISFDIFTDAHTSQPIASGSSFEESNADRFVSARRDFLVPLNITPRTNRIAKDFGLLEDRLLAHSETPKRREHSGISLLPLFRQSATKLYEIRREVSSISAASNLAKNRHFLVALSGPGMSRHPFSSPIAWSHSNLIAVAFKRAVYYQNLETKDVIHICSADDADGHMYSIDWGGRRMPNTIAAGTEHGTVQLWDVQQLTKGAAWAHDNEGMGGMHWSDDVLAVGRRNGGVCMLDPRTRTMVAELSGHKHHVHGVRWSIDSRQLATSDDVGLVNVWDRRMNDVVCRINSNPRMRHPGPVKALAWSEWQSDLLATGGALPDGTIRIWNTKHLDTSDPVLKIPLKTSVTSLHWSPHCKELLSTHGGSWTQYRSPASRFSQYKTVPSPLSNSITVHAYPSGDRIVSVEAHQGAVGHSCMSPDGCSVFTMSATEHNIKMFKVWSAPAGSGKGASSFSFKGIR
ncbi:WD40 repeat-like protein [Coniophora puteana RWD-64-598 SS2]|uniref:WD40 repeat-like protein n=1 Tax=Coniophora puteana (strain RWD-64-598) TaxID=741705 RepID=A0A5M3MBP0_CONPW|nr:WD40 repeat-like protein [Coniophora puteana RWD-64-598 SS2]EIW76652.1 WD40 repeat-like protein [Coniophora puteana RWD-64-598 SS2]